MSAFDLGLKRWLFCMTHPDDEISICVWMKRLVENGNEVFVSWTHSIPIREAEARENMEKLGIPSDHLTFMSATDGSVCDELESLLPQFRELMAWVKPDAVACGAFEQGHIDHDSTNFLVNQTFDGPIYEVPFYHVYDVFPMKYQVFNRFSHSENVHRLSLSKDEATWKKQFAKTYKSQNIWSLLLGYEASQILQLRRPELCRREYMRLQSHRDWQTPNHPEPLRAKVKATKTWSRWLVAVTSCDQAVLARSKDAES